MAIVSMHKGRQHSKKQIYAFTFHNTAVGGGINLINDKNYWKIFVYVAKSKLPLRPRKARSCLKQVNGRAFVS